MQKERGLLSYQKLHNIISFSRALVINSWGSSSKISSDPLVKTPVTRMSLNSELTQCTLHSLCELLWILIFTTCALPNLICHIIQHLGPNQHYIWKVISLLRNILALIGSCLLFFSLLMQIMRLAKRLRVFQRPSIHLHTDESMVFLRVRTRSLDCKWRAWFRNTPIFRTALKHEHFINNSTYSKSYWNQCN